MIHVRVARVEDDPALSRIDAITWSAENSPHASAPSGEGFFSERRQPEDVLVAELDGAVAGYAILRQAHTMDSHAHVLELNGLAVDQVFQRNGIGRRLIEAAVDEAVTRHARKLSLRVLSTNPSARRLYAACGFVTEGVLRSEFVIAGRDVDDVVMARYLGNP